MIFLADENIDFQIVQRIRQDGHEVLFVCEMEPGIRDDQVLALAKRENAILITGDRDFGELIFRQGLSARGVVLIRLSGLSPDQKAQIVSSVIQKHGSELENAFAVISPGTVRIRKGKCVIPLTARGSAQGE